MSKRLAFEPAAIYHYPEHLRPSLEALPAAPGVYVFHGESETMPLYIGKSINIRSRVMAHFRNVDEANMLRQSRYVSFTATAGELGALLLEAQMIKLQQPLFNKRLRKNRQLCSLRIIAGKPDVVYARDVNFSHTPDLFGLFSNRRAALLLLQKIADEQRLCHSLLGLEKRIQDRACFRASLGRCAGACCGKESVETHYQRLHASLEAVRVRCWPWNGAVGLIETGVRHTQIHVINNWFYLGSANTLTEAVSMTSTPQGFDCDGYKILCKPLLSGKLPVVSLT